MAARPDKASTARSPLIKPPNQWCTGPADRHSPRRAEHSDGADGTIANAPTATISAHLSPVLLVVSPSCRANASNDNAREEPRSGSIEPTNEHARVGVLSRHHGRVRLAYQLSVGTFG